MLETNHKIYVQLHSAVIYILIANELEQYIIIILTKSFCFVLICLQYIELSEITLVPASPDKERYFDCT